MAIHLDANISEQIVEALLVAVLGAGEGRPELRCRLPAVEEHQLLAVHDVEGGLEPGLAIKNPNKTPKNKKHLKNPLKIFFKGFFRVFSKYLIFYENNTNFSL
jgi:hypothetical protein